MGMLSNMLYLNVHHQLPMIQAHNRLASLDSHSTPARLSGTNKKRSASDFLVVFRAHTRE